jgi:hypothetical protein
MFKTFMSTSLVSLFIAGLALAAPAARDPRDPQVKPTPIMRSIQPDTVKRGSVLTVTGEYLDKTRIAEVYLTRGDDNFKLDMMFQSENRIVVKVPASVPVGRLRLMILTAGLEPQFIEQPLMIVIE